MLLTGVAATMATRAEAQSAVSIRVENTDVGDLFVSLFDLNTANNAAVFTDQRINRNQVVTVAVSPDGDGRGRIGWRARRTEGDPPKTAQRGPISVSNNDKVDVTTYFD